MNRFNDLMDDMKEALELSSRYKGIFLPALIGNVVLFVVIIIAIVGMVFGMIGTGVGAAMAARANEGFGALFAIIGGMVIAMILMTLVITIAILTIEIGIIGLVIGVTEDQKPSAGLFFGAVKEHLLPVIGTNIALFFIYIIAFVILLIPLVIYLLTVGILSGGWAMLLLSCTMQALLGYWVLIKVEDRIGGFEGLRRNIKFGRHYYWLLILVVYLEISFAGYLPSLLGLIGAAIGSIFIAYVVSTYFKIVVLLTYRRYKNLSVTE